MTVQARPGGRPRPRADYRVFHPDTAPTYRFGIYYPHGALADRARVIGQRFKIPATHLPKWRLRFAVLVGLLPVVWLLPKCRECGQPWPCTPLTDHFRHNLGWASDLTDKYRAMSTKRRRAKASRRNPTAISHRRLGGRRGWRRPRTG